MKKYMISEPYPDEYMTWCVTDEFWGGHVQVGSNIGMIYRFECGEWGFEMVDSRVFSAWLAVGTVARELEQS